MSYTTNLTFDNMLSDELSVEYDYEEEIDYSYRLSTTIKKDYALGKLTWTQKDGSKIGISDMSIAHILNTIRYIKTLNKIDSRNIRRPVRDTWIYVLETELLVRKTD